MRQIHSGMFGDVSGRMSLVFERLEDVSTLQRNAALHIWQAGYSIPAGAMEYKWCTGTERSWRVAGAIVHSFKEGRGR